MSLALFRRNPGLGRLLLAQGPSDMADWLAFVAIGARLAFDWDAGYAAFAWMGVALGLPYLTVGVVAGAMVDRMPLRAVMVWSNLVRGLCYAAMVLAPGPVALLALVFAGHAADAFFAPARQAAIQALAAEGDRMQANGLSLAINQGSKILAPAAGGVVLAAASAELVFLATGAFSFAASLLLLRLRLPARTAAGAAPRLWADLGEGVRLVARSGVLRAVVTLMAAGFFAMFLYDTLIPPLIRAFGHEEAALGTVMAAIGAGGLLGALGMSQVRATANPFALIALAAVCSSGLAAAVGMAELAGLAPPVTALAGFALLIGIVSSAMVVPIRTLIQNETTDRTVARVTALSEAANTAALLTAPFLGAWIAGAHGVGAAFVAGGALFALIALRAVVAARAAGRARGRTAAPGRG